MTNLVMRGYIWHRDILINLEFFLRDLAIAHLSFGAELGCISKVMFVTGKVSTAATNRAGIVVEGIGSAVATYDVTVSTFATLYRRAVARSLASYVAISVGCQAICQMFVMRLLSVFPSFKQRFSRK